jgi:hypothetical protein
LDCENKNNDIVTEIKQLDDFIENERSRWKRRLDSEKLAMNNRVQSLYTGGKTSVNCCSYSWMVLVVEVITCSIFKHASNDAHPFLFLSLFFC